ncbi:MULTISPECIES: DOMON-like domain-containing protein [unclassified Streptomyces]|uniref:DOMON-like domain-containing protein n=1 Tax=unclassified Streptomyces TaxID=2593676 RepID=UPI003245EE02
MTSRLPRRFSLRPFTPSGFGIVRALDVQVEEPVQGTFTLRYTLYADLSRLRIPATRSPRHTDELWKHTCFEMFVRKWPDSLAYYELNVSPSTEWALYTFDDYHQNGAQVHLSTPPRVHFTREPDRLHLDVRLDMHGLPHARRMALSAVVEDDNGDLSHWALKHVSPKPDFHHPDSFIAM